MLLVISIFSGFAFHLYVLERRRYIASISLAKMLRAEISAIVETACRRDFVGMAYQVSVNSASDRNDRCWPIVDFTILAGSAYPSFLSLPGILTPTLSGAVAEFFTNLGQLVRDSILLQSGSLKDNPAFDLQLQDGVRLWSRIETHGALTMDELEVFASQSFRAWLFGVRVVHD